MALEFLWQDAVTETDPGAGNLNFNDVDWTLVTAIVVSTADRFANDVTAWLAALDVPTSAIKGRLRVEGTVSAAAFADYDVTAVTLDAGFYLLTVAFVAQGAALSDGDTVGVTFAATGDPGDDGDDGDDGDNGTNGADGTPASLQMTFSTSITDVDPGTGNLRFNNATIASATYIYADAADRFGNAITAWWDALDDVDNAVWRSLVTIIKANDPSVWVVAKVTGDVEAPSGYRKIPIVIQAVSSVALADADTVAISASLAGGDGATGNTGATGATGATGDTGPAVDPDAFTGTSVTVLAIELGLKVFAADTGRVWVAGQRLRAASLDAAKVMEGAVSEYSAVTGNLTIAVDFVKGTGAHNDWHISVAGEVGATGSQGSTGDTGDDGSGIEPDATGTLAQRAAHDAAAQGYVYLQTDIIPFRLWVKASAVSGDWAGPTNIGASEFAIGDWGAITDLAGATYDFGSIA